jgi:hypothetical protein
MADSRTRDRQRVASGVDSPPGPVRRAPSRTARNVARVVDTLKESNRG